MSASWLVWRRAARCAPALLALTTFLVVGSTVLFAVGSVFVARAASEAAEGRGGSLTAPLIGLFATLIGAALTNAVLAPVCLRLVRKITLDQLDDVLGRIAHAESRHADATTIRSLAGLAQRTVSMRHRGALGSLPALLRVRCRGWAGVVVLAAVSPVAAAVLAACTIAYGRAFTEFLDDVLGGLDSEGPLETQRARYVRSLHFDHSIAGELRVFGALPWFLRSFSALSQAGREKAFRNRQRHAASVAGFAALCTVALLGSVASLVAQAWSGELGIGALTLAVQGALLVLDLGPAGDMGVSFRQVAQLEGGLHTSGAVPPAADAGQQPAGGRHEIAVAIRGVRHVYPGAAHPALDVPELIVREGERVAFVGRNGAGKSTLLGVIAGYLQPTEGAVEIAQESVAITLQRAVRYPTDLVDNVRLGDATADVERAFAALGASGGDLQAVRGDEMLGGPGVEGSNLSGGQWQRIGLARAFARSSSSLLLLDEPSAALDPVAEAEFFQSAVRNAAGRTVLLSTHHLPNVRFADRIVLLDAGRIVAQGTHSDLMRESELYATMFNAQAASYGVVAN